MERGKGTEEGEGGDAKAEGRSVFSIAPRAATAFPPIIVLLNAPGGPCHKLAPLLHNIEIVG